MNKENLLKVAEMVENGSHKFNGMHAIFNMADWINYAPRNINIEFFEKNRPDVKDVHACNTTACIAGYAALLADYETFSDSRRSGSAVVETAREYLGLTMQQAQDLFCGLPSPRVTGPQAAKVIRAFVETGKISWTPILDEMRLTSKYDASKYDD